MHGFFSTSNKGLGFVRNPWIMDRQNHVVEWFGFFALSTLAGRYWPWTNRYRQKT